MKSILPVLSLAALCDLAVAKQLLPEIADEPTPGKRTLVISPEYASTDVHHVLYLPTDWTPERKWPVIVEYTGNYAPTLGSTGLVEDAALGYGISGGECIWVVLPYVSTDGKSNERTWWGDIDASVTYAKTNVPRICEEFGGDPDAVVVCGFSRGAIGVNFIGLHDKEIAMLWCGFFTHDHYDGVKEWRGTDWGSPLKKYREEAAERLGRIGSRPVMVCQNGGAGTTRDYLRGVVSLENFTFLGVSTARIFPEFPNPITAHQHTDRWLLVGSRERDRVRAWFAETVKRDTVAPVRDR